MKDLLRLPGILASILMIIITAVWTFWGAAEMYHEGWWGAWYNRLPYLVPVALTLIPSLLAFRWPIFGGVLLILIGTFAIFFFGSDVAFIGIVIPAVGSAFLVDGILKRKVIPEPDDEQAHWWRRKGWAIWRYLLLLGLPVFVFLVVSIYNLPTVLTRVDDGERGAQVVDGNGVTLVWAPEGPGWNWKQPWGGYPSWQSIALYGVPPVGMVDKPGYGRQDDGEENTVYASGEEMSQYNLCRYLSADGTVLMEEPQDIWRMPTTDEIVRSLVRHGENAGCTWTGEIRKRAVCDLQPDKESPLWATDQAPIYYWTADPYDDSDGYFVSYNGMVNTANKLGGNPRHSYRCVREP